MFQRTLVAVIALAAITASYAAQPVAELNRIGSLAADHQNSRLSTRLIVKFRPEPDRGRESLQTTLSQVELVERDALATIGELDRKLDARLKLGRRVSTGAHLVKVEKQLTRRQWQNLLRKLGRQSTVEAVELDTLMQAHREPSDPDYSAQWHYYETLAGINLPQAWKINKGGSVVVAILDTGQTDHADLLANTLPGYDFISDTFASRDGNLRDSDPRDEGDWNPVANECYQGSPRSTSSWHGTHVAGTVAAATHNGLGVAGIAHRAMIQHVRVLGRCGGYTSDVADAIVWASGGAVAGVPDNPTPASVINLSLGGYSPSGCSPTYEAAINIANSNGATVVVPAGNSNYDAGVFSPAACSAAITVAASDRSGNRAFYSNYGAAVDITAPGGETSIFGNGILSTLNVGTTVPTNDTYAWYRGTSMSAAHVSGVAALLYSVNPSISPAQVKAYLQSEARTLPGSCTEGCGAGLLDARASVAAVYESRTPASQTEGSPRRALAD